MQKTAMAHMEMDKGTLFEVKGLKKFFPIYNKAFIKKQIGTVKASNDLNFKIKRGTTLGMVGESGCGKTTTARAMIRALDPTAGEVWFNSDSLGPVNLAEMQGRELKAIRKEISMIFQNPFSSLNPRMTVGEIVSEQLTINDLGSKEQRMERAADLLEKVGLNRSHMHRYPHSFSGGQRQRIGIARALIMNPQFIVCDESVSALDVSVQAQVINLLKDLQKEFNLTYLFVAHDLSVVRFMCEEIAVMYAGSIVEYGKTDEVFANPQHPYTQGLLAAIPSLDPDVKMKHELQGEVLDITKLPPGCPFYSRCKLAKDHCRDNMPPLESKTKHQDAACFEVKSNA